MYSPIGVVSDGREQEHGHLFLKCDLPLIFQGGELLQFLNQCQKSSPAHANLFPEVVWVAGSEELSKPSLASQSRRVIGDLDHRLLNCLLDSNKCQDSSNQGDPSVSSMPLQSVELEVHL